MLAQILHWLLIFLGFIIALAFLGLMVFVNEGILLFPVWKKKEVPEDNPTPVENVLPEDNPNFNPISWALGFLLIFIGLAVSGAALCLCVALLASPMLIFRFALGWSWENSALPGVLAGIALVIIALYIFTVRDEKFRARQEEVDSVRKLKKRI